MRVRGVSDDVPSAVRFLPIVLANLVPLVGVLAYGWKPSTLVVIYALEVILAFPLAAVKALFAGQPPQVEELETDEDEGDSSVIDVGNTDLARKHGSVRVVSWLPPVYPRNLPFVGAVFFVTVWVVLFVVGALSEVVVGDALAQPVVWLSVAGLLLGQGLETWHEYLRGGRYETTSPYAVIETPARQGFFLMFVLLVVAEAGGMAVLAAFVAVKLLVDWSAFRATHGGGGRLTGWLAGPENEGERDAPEQPRIPDADPDARFETHTRTVVLTGVFRTLVKSAPFYAGMVVLAWLVTFAVLGESSGSGVLLSVGISLAAFVALVAFLAIKIAERVLEYAALEYRRYDDRLVAYDAWVEEPQWSVPCNATRDVTVVADRLPDRVFGTRTFEAKLGWGDEETMRELGPVEDAPAFVEAFELLVPAPELDLPAVDRRIAAIAIAPIAGVPVAVAAFVVGLLPVISVIQFVVFGLPAVAFVLYGIWQQAYPDTG
ncbi:DUF6498-containing protein [Natronobacterium gregoryi]|uniref:Uncharacterized protein n=2 Tax=Natronobacterium gregoryi TaxID=44930 RepID=L0AGH3_NATGS|nr:DUF6498-containing protein [Natronobacterium gregoryi]AFZ72519.1 hypothetical protein Natgr_1299 [Natronobacterium gregoryi SP2]ELY74392.1 hypothetical protein C490_00455 [Natronobacterium gregoryi SP2]PLK21488.1 hypothetical protein CYV19_04135 [Natronobacterium gregoryi SP2]SFI76577.1 hypothetical protein SAMN05443661_10542 [Natronobacterium gregoryi]